MTTRRMWAFQMLSLVLALLIAPAAAAQRLSDLDDMDRQVTCGQQVVVTESNGQRVKGRVTGVDGSTLTLLVDEGFDQR
jgi:hypothetical protein